MTQCELWTDNNDMGQHSYDRPKYSYQLEPDLSMVEDRPVQYGYDE